MLQAMLITTFVLSPQQTLTDYGSYASMQECQAMVEVLEIEYVKANRKEEVYCVCLEVETAQDNESELI